MDSSPLYRYYNSGSNDHFYTTNFAEIGTTTPGSVGNFGYKYEGVAGYCYKTQTTGTVPFFRYWNDIMGDHFYTTNLKYNEIGTTTPGNVGKYGYKSEGVACYVFP